MSAFVGGDGISADGSIDVDMVLPTGRIRLRALVRQKSGSHYRFEFIEMTPELTQQVTDAKKKMQPFINRVMGGGKRKELNPGGEAK